VGVHTRFLDIAALIRTRLEAGEWEPGARLPRLNDFASQYDANRDTIGRAIEVLESEGFVQAVQGRGIICRRAARQHYDPTRLVQDIQELLEAQGLNPVIRPGNADVAAASARTLLLVLGITPGADDVDTEDQAES
jgi:DNA-binding GntR family transcriptional regulator